MDSLISCTILLKHSKKYTLAQQSDYKSRFQTKIKKINKNKKFEFFS
jgi:hypothetical protein